MSVPTRLGQRPLTARRLASATAIAAIGVAVALGTTGCGAGQISQTANQLPAVNGGNANASWGPVEVRNVQIIYPAANAAEVFGNGGPFDLSFTAVNSGDIQVYKLTKVEVTQAGAPSSAKVTLSAQPVIPAGVAIRAGNPANVFATSSSAAPTTSASQSPTSAAPESSATESATPTTSTATGEISAPRLGESAISASIDGTGKSVAAGLTTELTFYFQMKDANGNWVDAGTVTADAAVDSTVLPTRVDAPRGGEPAGEGGH